MPSRAHTLGPLCAAACRNASFYQVTALVTQTRPYGALYFAFHWGGNWGYPKVHDIGNSGKDEEIYNRTTVGGQDAMWRVIYGMC
jgi:hypothetical protein